ncbi:MAG: hypothetical protein ACRENX_01805 [Candidatus Dormibacteria bacterium]
MTPLGRLLANSGVTIRSTHHCRLERPQADLGRNVYLRQPKAPMDYVDEQAFRFNFRVEVDGSRFTQAVRQSDSKRLTYKTLTHGL